MAVNKLDITMMEDVGTSASQLLQRDGSGNIPAVDGSQVIGLSEFTTSTSDPVITTNPSGGVGSLWYNKTSGTMYVCTTATAGANVWTNVGAGTDNIQPWGFQGEQYGYHYSSGDQGNSSVNRISFASDGNAVDTGADLTASRSQWAGSTGQTYGYCAGGYSVGGTTYNIIDKIAYASDGSMSDCGDIINTYNGGNNQFSSSNDADYAYHHGGVGATTTIERFQMVATANSADVGDLSIGSSAPGGNSDVGAGYGYVPGRNGHGTTPSATQKQIDRYQMQASTYSSDVGDMFDGTGNHGGASSQTHGYQAGCGEGDTDNVIQKNNFAASVTSVDVGNLTVARFDCTGTSSTTYAYMSAGLWPDQTTIDKFSFASDGDATDVGDLTSNGRYTGCTGSQY